MAENASRLTTLGLGAGTFSLGVLATAAVGSLLTQGNIVTDSAFNTAPSLVYDSGSYLTYQETRATNSGTNALYAQLGIPATYASGAYIHRVSYECKTAVTQGYDLVVSSGDVSNGSGSQRRVLLNNAQVTSRSQIMVDSGSLIPNNNKVIIYAGTGAASATDTDCKLKLWTSETY